MKNQKIKNTLYAICLLASVSLVGCSDWTEVEALNLNQPNIESQNPELYARYLQNLKTYKASNHAYTYVWFDNSEKDPFNRAQHLTAIPDSVDVIALLYPDKLVDRELKEMDQVRASKGTRIVYSLNFDEIKQIYDNKNKAKSAERHFLKDAAVDPFLTYLNDTMKYALSLADKYKFDGIIASFKGKGIGHMTDAEKVAYISYESAFIGAINAWHQNNKSKIFVFEGMPQYLTDKAILTETKHIIIPCRDVDNNGQLSYRILMAKIEGVPSDRFIVSVQTKSLDPQDSKTGIWADGQTRSIKAVASWAAAGANYGVAGIGIANVNNDYFNSGFIFRYTREAISILNPSIKK